MSLAIPIWRSLDIRREYWLTTREYIASFDLEKDSNKLLVLLLMADLAFVLVHCAYKTHLIESNKLLSIGADFGYAEVYQYIKELWIALMLLVLTMKRKHLVYFSWSLLFMYFLLDDSLQVHETLGAYLASHYGLQPMLFLRAKDFGEIVVSMSSGLVLLILILVAYTFSDHAAKQASRHILALVMLLAFFGVVVDMIHIAIPWGKQIFGLIEDGGEMLIMSIIVWYVFDLRLTLKQSTIHDASHQETARVGWAEA